MSIMEPANSNYECEDRRLNRLELSSIRALVAYAAYTQCAGEETVREILQDRFKVRDISDITANTYEEAIRFLVDVQISMVVH